MELGPAEKCKTGSYSLHRTLAQVQHWAYKCPTECASICLQIPRMYSYSYNYHKCFNILRPLWSFSFLILYSEYRKKKWAVSHQWWPLLCHSTPRGTNWTPCTCTVLCVLWSHMGSTGNTRIHINYTRHADMEPKCDITFMVIAQWFLYISCLCCEAFPPFLSFKNCFLKSLLHRVGKQYTYLQWTCLVLLHGHHVVVPLVLGRGVGLCNAL